VNRDSIEELGGNNLSVFCGNDGIGSWDYLGLKDYCCCRGALVSDLKITSGVQISRYSGKEPWPPHSEGFVHYWISWPGGSADVNALNNDMVRSPAGGKDLYEAQHTETEYVSLCEIDLVKLWECLSQTADDLDGEQWRSNACKEFAKTKMRDNCMKEAKGCTNPDEVDEYLDQVSEQEEDDEYYSF
jgi:hypothetical protein